MDRCEIMEIKKIVAIIVVGLFIATIFPCAGATINKTDEKENITIYESRIFGVGFVRIHSLTHEIKGFVLFGINDGQVISKAFIDIKYNEVDNVYAGYLPLFIFFIRYNPA